ncbi:TonB-dependent receptor domain-containing protein [Kineobactrum salinum]|uniref:TonB-dependent receptor n=1 Tax=Kineobactrum salinum TaxID=2708301 RepID=A0A6C0U7N9_9GAMM|nr:TonB-dependent receptor [Kineobactrum salinum]QIB66997.1 TonB-dependent receptor [Kineobactrum salinum]
MGLLLPALAIAQELFRFDLPAGPANVALREYARQSGRQVLLPRRQLKDYRSNAVRGRYAADEALSILLAESGLEAEVDTAGTLVVKVADNTQGGEGEEMKQQDKGLLARMVNLFTAPAVAAAVATGGVTGATAQTERREGDTRPVLEEVIVTALKREQALMDAPISVSAFTGDDLERMGADNLGDFLQRAPGVAVNDTGNGSQVIYIRGLSSIFGDPPVGFYLDEIPFTTIGITGVPDVRSFDLERVEVLRGPQGTLYGASSLGGTIRILTRDPEHNEFQFKGDVSYSDTEGSSDNRGYKAAVNLPLVNDTLSLRAAVTHEEESGWIDLNDSTGAIEEEGYNDFDVTTWRGKLRFTPSERVDVIASAWNYDSDASGGNLANDNGLNDVFAVGGGRASTDAEYEIYSALVNIDLGAFTLSSSTATMDFDLFSDSVFGTTDRLNQNFTQEFRLTSNGDSRIFWVAGAIYSEVETFAEAAISLPGVNFLFTENTESENWAVYGELTYSFSDTLDGTIGVRYFEDDRRRNDTTGDVAFPELGGEYDDISPRLSLAWRPDDNTLVYGTISKGFRSGQTQPAVTVSTAALLGISVPEEVGAEEAWSFEAGMKLTRLDGRFSLESALYYIDWDDLQTVVEVVPATLGAFMTAGSSSAYGLDLALRYSLTDMLSFSIGGNWNSSTYDEDVLSADGMTLVYEEGKQINEFPKYTLSGSVDYLNPGAINGMDFIALAALEHMAERTTGFGAIRTSGDETTRLNARVGIQDENWGLYLFGENLNDEGGAVVPQANSVLALRYRPRTIGLNLKFNF